MSDNTPEEKPAATTPAPAANVREQPRASVPEATDMICFACAAASEPWKDESMRLRSIVFFMRSAMRLREMEHSAMLKTEEMRLMREREARDERRIEVQREVERETARIAFDQAVRQNDRDVLREAQRASEARNSAMLEAVIQSVVAAQADGKTIDLPAMMQSVAHLKSFLDTILKA